MFHNNFEKVNDVWTRSDFATSPWKLECRVRNSQIFYSEYFSSEISHLAFRCTYNYAPSLTIKILCRWKSSQILIYTRTYSRKARYLRPSMKELRSTMASKKYSQFMLIVLESVGIRTVSNGSLTHKSILFLEGAITESCTSWATEHTN